MRFLKPRVGALDVSTARPARKVADPIYSQPAYLAFRDVVLARAGHRCEQTVNGKRCDKRAPADRLVADHIVEVKDQGRPFDPSNGQCLCVAHNTAKGLRARAARFSKNIS